MAWTKVKCLRRQSSRDTSGPVETWTYLAVSDSPTTTYPSDAETANDGTTAIAGYYTSHPTRPNLKATKVDADYFEDGRGRFKVVVTWGVPQWGFDDTRPDGPDIKWNVRVSGSGLEYSEGVNQDRDGYAIRNAVGDKYPAEIQLTNYDELITVEFDTDVLHAAIYRKARGKLNSDSITLTITKNGLTYTDTFPPSTLRCGNISWEATLDRSDAAVWHVAIPLMYRHNVTSDGDTDTEHGWARGLVDKGYRYKSTAGGSIVQENPATLNYLAEDGTKLAEGDQVHIIYADVVQVTAFMAFLSDVST